MILQNKTKQTQVRLVITGFDPFEDHLVNPSASLAVSLARAFPFITCLVLPTSYEQAAPTLFKVLDEQKPSICLMLGVARTPYSLRLEDTARNRDLAKSADNDGQVRHGVIDASFPHESITSPFQGKQLAQELVRQGHDVALSHNAGGYVCNHAYFQVLQHLCATNYTCSTLFVHIPGASLRPATTEAATALIRLLIASTSNTSSRTQRG